MSSKVDRARERHIEKERAEERKKVDHKKQQVFETLMSQKQKVAAGQASKRIAEQHRLVETTNKKKKLAFEKTLKKKIVPETPKKQTPIATKKSPITGQSQKTQTKKNAKVRSEKKEDRKVTSAAREMVSDRVVLKRVEREKEDEGLFDDSDASDDFFQIAAELAMQKPAQTRPSRLVGKIPSDILDKLVEDVSIGINKRGLAEFTIQFQEGILDGGSVKVSTSDGEILLEFFGLRNETKKDVQNALPMLENGLRKKKLKLGKLAFG